jgi:hypothetical protein
VIISKIIGGLGNQMFQFAAGYALAKKHGVPLRLDTEDFANYRLHQGFELDRVFELKADIANEADFSRVLGWRKPDVIRRMLSRPRLSFLSAGRFIVEPHFDYWSGIESVGSECYLTGYWQTEKYFQSVAQEISKSFCFREPLRDRNIEWEQMIRGSTSVSLHVRRGDYVSNATTNSAHGTCGLDYYRSAIEKIVSQVDSPRFFVFSDDIPWVVDNLKIAQPVHYISNNVGKYSYIDMQLMTLCRHNIIANSSFSWWGAWLNDGCDKIVVAPKAWFSGKSSPKDLYPDTWQVL